MIPAPSMAMCWGSEGDMVMSELDVVEGGVLECGKVRVMAR
jgi:hypothetical protein